MRDVLQSGRFSIGYLELIALRILLNERRSRMPAAAVESEFIPIARCLIRTPNICCATIIFFFSSP